jgi:hypothetical protein
LPVVGHWELNFRDTDFFKLTQKMQS